jgi:hypothetical protein
MVPAPRLRELIRPPSRLLVAVGAVGTHRPTTLLLILALDEVPQRLHPHLVHMGQLPLLLVEHVHERRPLLLVRVGGLPRVRQVLAHRGGRLRSLNRQLLRHGKDRMVTLLLAPPWHSLRLGEVAHVPGLPLKRRWLLRSRLLGIVQLLLVLGVLRVRVRVQEEGGGPVLRQGVLGGVVRWLGEQLGD